MGVADTDLLRNWCCFKSMGQRHIFTKPECCSQRETVATKLESDLVFMDISKFVTYYIECIHVYYLSSFLLKFQ